MQENSRRSESPSTRRGITVAPSQKAMGLGWGGRQTGFSCLFLKGFRMCPSSLRASPSVLPGLSGEAKSSSNKEHLLTTRTFEIQSRTPYVLPGDGAIISPASSEPSLNPSQGEKIANVRLLLIWLIVLAHADNLSVSFRGHAIDMTRNTFLWSIEQFFSAGIAKSAVPLFFCISGFLFFRTFELTWESYRGKLAHRIRSLAIPYLLWSGAALVLTLVMQRVGMLSDLFFHRSTAQLSSTAIFESWLLHPLPSQLWYLQCLMLLAVTAPLTFFLVKRFGAPYLVLLAILWYLLPFHSVLQFRGIFCFSVGAYLVSRSESVFTQRKPILGAIVWILATVLMTAAARISGHAPPAVLLHLASLLGAYVIWFGYDFLSMSARRSLSSIAFCSYFVFLMHEPLQGALMKLALVTIGSTASSHLLLFFLLPAVTVILCTAAGRRLRRHAPRLFEIVTGKETTEPLQTRSALRPPAQLRPSPIPQTVHRSSADLLLSHAPDLRSSRNPPVAK